VEPLAIASVIVSIIAEEQHAPAKREPGANGGLITGRQVRGSGRKSLGWVKWRSPGRGLWGQSPQKLEHFNLIRYI